MKTIIFFLLVLVAISLKANAISVVSDYLVNNTLELQEGTSKIYSIRLQNPTDREIAIKLDYDSTYMKAIDYKELYEVPPQTNYKVLFNVTAPEKPGLYVIGYTVSEVEPAGGGGLGLLLKINRNFKLKAIENPDKFRINYGYMAYATIVIVFLIYLIMKKHKIKHSKYKARKFL